MVNCCLERVPTKRPNAGQVLQIAQALREREADRFSLSTSAEGLALEMEVEAVLLPSAK